MEAYNCEAVILVFIGTGTVHELVCQPLDETEGAQPRIRLTGIIYRVEWASRMQAWNVSERKCIIDQSPLRDVVLFLPNTEQRRGFGRKQ